MFGLSIPLSELAGMFLGVMLTLGVFSYLFRNNIIFRLMLSLLIGVSAGFTVVVVFDSVIINKVVFPITKQGIGGIVYLLIPVIMASFLLFQFSKKFVSFSRFTLSFITGVMSATIIGGALLGTLLPQTLAVVNSFSIDRHLGFGDITAGFIEAILILIGTISVLWFFNLTFPPIEEWHEKIEKVSKPITILGKIFIAIVLGAVFAGVFTASLSVLVTRLRFLVDFVRLIFIQ